MKIIRLDLKLVLSFRRNWMNSCQEIIMICNDIQKRAGTSIVIGGIHICSINICEMSERSQFMLNKYEFDQNISILAVQETGESSCLQWQKCN